jgi:hypothetical protein
LKKKVQNFLTYTQVYTVINLGIIKNVACSMEILPILQIPKNGQIILFAANCFKKGLIAALLLDAFSSNDQRGHPTSDTS